MAELTLKLSPATKYVYHWLSEIICALGKLWTSVGGTFGRVNSSLQQFLSLVSSPFDFQTFFLLLLLTDNYYKLLLVQQLR